MLAALLFSTMVIAMPQDIAALEEVGACYSAAVNAREIIQADNAAGYSEPDDQAMLDILIEIETAAGARMDAMKPFTDTLSDAELRAMDDRIAERLNGYDEEAFGDFMDQCVISLGIDAG